ncbi:VWA domain-containing protein [Kiloniella sp. EL199]|uniref:vWA domain-containing protein n=1 Tax=Kiloniella sp. EL199 TaxID=2107581 RepID=UPI000EA22E76|nr:VWA domain-containing protein [Kiloniella sp. EL199]
MVKAGSTGPLDNVQGFVSHLRSNGFSLGQKETEQALNVLINTNGNLARDRNRLKALFTGNHDQWSSFDNLFEAFWFRRGKKRNTWQHNTKTSEKSCKLPEVWSDHLNEETNGQENATPQIETNVHEHNDGEEKNQVATGRLIATKHTARTKTDLRQFVDPEEIAEAEKLAYNLAKAIQHKLSRRRRLDKRGRWLDFRRTIRSNVRYGGDLIDIKKQRIPERPVKIVVLLDVSGSMQHYSRFFLQFVKGLVCQWLESDAFLFHTKLIRVTDTIRDNNTTRAMTKLSLMAEGFGGGTKLGECLKVFNATYAKKTLTSRTTVIILSDGYEVGSAENLKTELQQLKKRAKRLIWLNPLLGWENYAPVTAAMQAALPHIDHFAAANTLVSLAAIEPELARL